MNHLLHGEPNPADKLPCDECNDECCPDCEYYENKPNEPDPDTMRGGYHENC
jgi:hypothetical protein